MGWQRAGMRATKWSFAPPLVVEVQGTANTSDQVLAFEVGYVSHIVNDGSVDLYVAFDADSTVAGRRITLRPGEVIGDLPVRVQTLHVSCASGTCPFRAVGMR